MARLFEKTDYEIERFEEDALTQSQNFWTEEYHIIRDNVDDIEKKWIDDRLKVVFEKFEGDLKISTFLKSKLNILLFGISLQITLFNLFK